MRLTNPVIAVAFATTFFASANLPEGKCDLRNNGAFAFPQDKATVLCDTEKLRVSAWSDQAHLYVQSVLWTDREGALGETSDGRPIGDHSSLILDADGDGKVTSNVDRTYCVNPWPDLPGLRYQVELGKDACTGILNDSQGRGSVRYVETTAGKVRVDSYVIPLAEIGRKTGDKVRFGFYGISLKPEVTLNSIGYLEEGAYYAHSLPWDKFHEMTLADRPATLDLKKIPDGRDKQVADKQVADKKMPLEPKP